MKNSLGSALDDNDTTPAGVNELNNDEVGMVALQFTDVVQSVINEAQFAILQGRTPKKYIKKRPGKGGKTFSYVPHGYVTAVLNKAFGFDWDWEIIPVEGQKLFLYMEGGHSGSKQKASILVHGKLTVRIHDKKGKTIATITKTSTGEKEEITSMSWGSLVKSAESDAFKKAASRLGIALDLYWQDADEDYIPAEKLSPDQQAVMDAIRKIVEANGEMISPPALASNLSHLGFKLSLPEVAQAMALYQKESK